MEIAEITCQPMQLLHEKYDLRSSRISMGSPFDFVCATRYVEIRNSLDFVLLRNINEIYFTNCVVLTGWLKSLTSLKPVHLLSLVYPENKRTKIEPGLLMSCRRAGCTKILSTVQPDCSAQTSDL